MTIIEELQKKIGIDVASLYRRCKLSDNDKAISDAFFKAFEVSYNMLDSVINKGMVEPTIEGQMLLTMLGEKLIGDDSHLINAHHIETALEYIRGGANVLMVQNHTSGADTFGWHVLVNRYFPNNVANDFAYISGHIVNIYPIPLILTSGLRRFQIFSTRYKGISNEIGFCEEEMKKQNQRALLSLKSFTSQGGKLVGLYPEGGRGDNALKFGDPNTAIIPKIMGTKKDLFIFPTYVQGATTILPVHRGPHEYDNFLRYVRPGKLTITCGELIPWGAIKSDDNNVIHEHIMRSIAALAPNESEKGVWRTI